MDRHQSLYALMPDTRSFQEYSRYFSETAEELIEMKSRYVTQNFPRITNRPDFLSIYFLRQGCREWCKEDGYNFRRHYSDMHSLGLPNHRQSISRILRFSVDADAWFSVISPLKSMT